MSSADVVLHLRDTNGINNNNNNIDESYTCYHIFAINGKKCRFCLNSQSIVWEQEINNNNHYINNARNPTTIPLSHVISVWTCYCQKPNTRSLLCDCVVNNVSSVNCSPNGKLSLVRLYYALPVGKYGWKVDFITIQSDSTHDNNDIALLDCLTRIRTFIAEYKRPKRLLVFVNPFGGNRKAPKVYERKVLPILQLSGIDINCVVTEHANHAKDIILDPNIPINKFDGIICVGGDGMFAELLNGILIRTQRDANINYSSCDSKLKRPSIALGVIPAGSTDAVAYGTTGINDPITSTVLIVLAKKMNIDVCAVHNKDDEKLIRYAATFLGYGYFGDTIADSENNRWMGPKRYDWAGIKKFIRHRLYTGEIKLLIEPSDGSPRDNENCNAGCNQCSKAALQSRDILNENDSPACISIRGKFLAINAATMSCRCGMTKRGIAPAAHLGNGCADLILVSQCTRVEYFKYLLRTALSAKSPFDLDFVNVYRVREFEFNPRINSHNKTADIFNISNTSVWNCDGEVVNVPAIRAKIHCQLISIFASGIEMRDK